MLYTSRVLLFSLAQSISLLTSAAQVMGCPEIDVQWVSKSDCRRDQRDRDRRTARDRYRSSDQIVTETDRSDRSDRERKTERKIERKRKKDRQTERCRHIQTDQTVSERETQRETQADRDREREREGEREAIETLVGLWRNFYNNSKEMLRPNSVVRSNCDPKQSQRAQFGLWPTKPNLKRHHYRRSAKALQSTGQT